PALEAKHVRPRPARYLCHAAFAHQPHRLFHLTRIRVAFLDQTHGQAVGAENELRARTVRKLPQERRDFLDESLDVKRMIMEMLNQMLRPAVARLSIDPPPFLQTAQSRGKRIVGI